jgi:hypothetical protein
MNRFSVIFNIFLVIMVIVFTVEGVYASDVNWEMFSKNIVRALQSDNEGLQQSAMQLVVKYGPKLDTKDAVFDVMRIYRNNKNQQVRRLALITLTKMQSKWAMDFLKGEIKYETDPVISKQLIALTSEPPQENISSEVMESAPTDFDLLQQEVSSLSKEEAHFIIKTDSDGQPLNASQNLYILHFAKNKFPPVRSFWSLALYNADTQELVANPVNNYPIQSPLVSSINKDADGGLTFYIQKESPGGSKKSNWLPAPDGQFYLIMRLYWPGKEVLDGKWTHPQIQKVK